MNKKLMALAVAGALGVPAAALAQEVQIYGRANVGVDQYSATGATAGSAADLKSRYRVFDQSSRLGFRGAEDLGGGMKAIYQIESGVNIDTGTTTGQGGQANTSAGTLATRDSYAGLEGGFGRVQFGRLALWYTNGNVEQMTANLVNIGTPESAGALSKISQPLTRQSNVAMYTSPNFSGANVGFYYVPNSEAAQANTNTDGNITGLVGTYSGIVNVKADWAKNKAQTGAAPVSDITGIKVGVGYPYAPGAEVSLIVISLQQTNVGAGQDTVKQAGFVLNWEQVFGNIQGLAQYGRSNKPTGCTGANVCDNQESSSYMVGARYLLSKRTAVYATYNKTTNKDASTLDYKSAGYTSANPGIGAGADPQIIGVGILHNF